MIHLSGRRCVALAVLLAAVGLLATPSAAAESHSYIDRIEPISPGNDRVYVYSAGMDRVIEQDVVHPTDPAPRPTVYVLNGVGGGIGQNSWREQTDILQFAADKGANVVIPVGGAGSYYTDWQRDDPALGRQKWTTYLTEELPQLIDTTFHGTGLDGIIGSSMSVTAAVWLAEQHPDRFRAVGAFSGCAETSSPQGIAAVNAVTRLRGGADPENMWGPMGGPAWVDHDGLLHADRLRGLAIYLSSGNGVLGRYPYDQGITDPVIWNEPNELRDGLLTNSAIEVATSGCTRRLAQRLADLGIPATYRPHEGIHAWGYWQESLHDFWPALSAAIGATPR